MFWFWLSYIICGLLVAAIVINGACEEGKISIEELILAVLFTFVPILNWLGLFVAIQFWWGDSKQAKRLQKSMKHEIVINCKKE